MSRPTDTELATMSWFDLRREADRARGEEASAHLLLDAHQAPPGSLAERVQGLKDDFDAVSSGRIKALGRLAHASQELHQRSGHDGTWAECQQPTCAGDRELVKTGYRNARQALPPDPAAKWTSTTATFRPAEGAAVVELVEPRCSGCGGTIDPTTCWCGSPVDGHGYGDGHSAVPMGCECHRRGPSERETP